MKQRTKVIYCPAAGATPVEYEGADGIDVKDGKIVILSKGKIIAIEGCQRRGIEFQCKSAWIVREKKKSWKLKLVKE
jgi:hypothetical protein